MGLNWLQSLIYGFISGFTEFLPVPSDGHRLIFLELIGVSDSAVMRLSVRLGALLALAFLCAPMIAKLNRERKIASITEKRRKRQYLQQSRKTDLQKRAHLYQARYFRICFANTRFSAALVV